MATTPAPSSPSSPAADVAVLRERVTRLERRLADLDGKLSLLLAARPDFSGPAVGASALPTSPRPPIRAAGLDLSAPPTDDVAIEDFAVEDATSDSHGDEDSVVIQMRGDAPALVSSPPGPVAVDGDARTVYAQAQALLKAGRHEEAVALFEELLRRFPADGYADNAVYWSGFGRQAQRQHRQAIEGWQRLPVRFPRSPKVPDALFGMALSHEALGEPALAEALYDEIVASYPRAEKRRDAQKALKRLRPTIR